MTLNQVWGVLLIFILCPILGGLPLIQWITYALTRQQLSRQGTGNISVSAAFYHAGPIAGSLAVASEALKGILAVLIARLVFPAGSAWEVIALMALVLGRYWIGRGAGITNVVWGYLLHDWITAGLVALIGGVGFTLVRERQLGQIGVLILLPLITALQHPGNGPLLGATVTLSVLLGWILHRIPDDLSLSVDDAQPTSRSAMQFFQGNRSFISLNHSLKAEKVGEKAAILSELKRRGYPVPEGWVVIAGDDLRPLINRLSPSPERPVIVRSSAVGEDSETASAAGQYNSILNITSPAALEQAILHCFSSYHAPIATRYRQERGVAESNIAVLVQPQIQGVFSGVAFSRDPLSRQGDVVVVEGLPGMATQVVSGQYTPEQYRVWIQEADFAAVTGTGNGRSARADRTALPAWMLTNGRTFPMEGKGSLPPQLVQQVAYLARQLEVYFHGMPQDIEWSYDGQKLWLLQSRPITTLLPIWTRKIAAEVIPGHIHPLTWSINRPLTCGVWGDIFTIVLGDRAKGLNFDETATLHNSVAYFNASLLGRIFRLMGLPPESLEFLTRGAKLTRPPLRSMLPMLPGLWRLARREWRLEKEFNAAMRDVFDPGLRDLQRQTDQLNAEQLLRRTYQLMRLLRQATYYSIMAPLSVAFRQSLLKVKETELDHGQAPEIASIRSLQILAANGRALISDLDRLPPNCDAVFAALNQSLAGQTVVRQFDQFLEQFGYLSEVATDIAVPTWKDDPKFVRDLFTQFLLNPTTETADRASSRTRASALSRSWKGRQLQSRVNLKGQVSAVYSRLLAELRWTFLALENHWLETKLLKKQGDIFFLEFHEIERLVTEVDSALRSQAPVLVALRRSQFEQHRQVTPALLVYGSAPPPLSDKQTAASHPTGQCLQGIGASSGQVEGFIKVLKRIEPSNAIDRSMILVVPYTDAGWAPLLAQAGGLIAEVGGQLSHGAIVAREYGIPAVMNIHHATQVLRDGQRVRLDGQRGTIEILES